MPLVKVSSKSQIVLPAKIRKQLAIKPGDILEIKAEDDVIVIRKAPSSFVEALERYASHIWHNYEKELQNLRNQWDKEVLND